MKVAVVTPFHQTPTDWLQNCLASVDAQTVPCTHFLVCDGDVLPRVELSRNVQILRLPRPHADFGNAPRAVGSVSAICQDFDAIAYLDSDNWFEPEHIEQLCEAHDKTGAAVCSSSRNLYDLEGQLLGSCPEVDGVRFVDTNCLFLTRAAFGLVAAWYLMPRSHVEVGDRLVWKAIVDSKLSRSHSPRPTVNYRTRHVVHYEHFGKTPPPSAKRINSPGKPLSLGKRQSSPLLLLPGRARARANGKATPTIAASSAIISQSSGQSPLAAVSLCMIVRNEEANLEKCLLSVADIVKEMIVVDTGSTDATKEVATRCGAKVIDFPWIDDFAAARNESLRHAGNEWILWLDADEYFDEENRERLKKLLGMLGPDKRVYMMKQWSFPEHAGGASALVVDHARLFRKRPGIGWKHRLHEQILPALRKAGDKVVFTDIVLRHVGYQDPATRMDKLAHNLRILLKEHEEMPDEAFTLFNLGGTYLDLGEREKSIPLFQRCLETSPKGATFLAKAYVLMAQLHRGLGKLDEGIAFCREGKRHFPNDAELWFEQGLLHKAKKDAAAAQECFERILNLPVRPNYVGTDAGLRGHLTRHHLALTLIEQKRPADAEEQWRKAVKEAPLFGPGWLGLAEICLEQRRFGEVDKMIARLGNEPQAGPIVSVVRARVCLAHGEHGEACGLMREAIGKSPRNTWLRMLFSDILAREDKNLDEAERQLQELLAIDPKQKRAGQRLEELRQRRVLSH